MGTRRQVLRGVRYDEMYLKKNPPLKRGVKISAFLSRKPHAPIASDLGCSCKYYAPFAADPLDQATLLNGAMYRFAREVPPLNPRILTRFRAFVRRYVRIHFRPIRRPVSYEEYLAGTHYTLKKREKLLELHNNLRGTPHRVVYKSFGKMEFINVDDGYSDFLKNVRCINGPEDRWKAYVGHLIHAVEKEVCKLKYFAKYIPVMDRPRVIYERLSPMPGPYWVTDYTSFEASFRSLVLGAAEGELYSYMLQDFEECKPIIKQMMGEHICKFRNFKVKVPGTRMSGDSNTSLGNGFTNLMLMLFLAEEQHLLCDGFVEGDDGLFAFNGTPDFSPIKELGFDLKLEPHTSLYTTSFCGLMLTRSLACLTEPVYEIVKFGWSMSHLRHSNRQSVLLGLLRAKALSLFYCHPRCPMLTALAIKFIKLTKNVDPIFDSGYWEQKIVSETVALGHLAREEYEKGITDDDRVDFFELFGIDISIQIAFEEYIKNIRGVHQLDHWTIDAICAPRPYLAWMQRTHVYSS